jgi:HEAT repeat protein
MHDPVPGLIQALSSASPAERMRAADALAELADPRAVPALIPLLADSTQVARDQWVSESACYALRRIGDPALDPLIAALKSPDAALRRGAAVCLGAMRVARAQAVLIDTLDDGDDDVSIAAMNALAELGTPDALDRVAAQLDSPILERQRHALMKLALLHDPRAFEPLLAALRHPNPIMRATAITNLSTYPTADTRVIEAIIRLLAEEPDDMVRPSAAAALGTMRDQRAVEPLIAALADGYVVVRQYAAQSLGMLGDARAIEPLKILLSDSEPSVREAAETAINRLHASFFGKLRGRF